MFHIPKNSRNHVNTIMETTIWVLNTPKRLSSHKGVSLRGRGGGGGGGGGGGDGTRHL
jgi:hypothetical protein